jgi:hypothetical protein
LTLRFSARIFPAFVFAFFPMDDARCVAAAVTVGRSIARLLPMAGIDARPPEAQTDGS